MGHRMTAPTCSIPQQPALLLCASASLWICISCALSFVAHQREMRRMKSLCSSGDKSTHRRDDVFRFPSNEQKSVWENATCIRLWILGVLGQCRGGTGCQDSLLHPPGKPAVKICRRKLLSPVIDTHFYPEYTSLSGKGSRNTWFKGIISQKKMMLRAVYQNLLYTLGPVCRQTTTAALLGYWHFVFAG